VTRYIFINIIFSLFSITVFSQVWYVEERNDLYGYVDSLGVVKIPFEYTFAYTDSFLNTIAFVADKGKIKVIDRNNRKLFTVFKLDNGPDYVEEGLFRIQDDCTGNIGFANMEGNMVVLPRFFHADPFRDGLAAFNVGGWLEPIGEYTKIAGGKWGYIDKTGKEIFPAIFDKAYPFEDGKAKVQIGDNIFCIKKCNH
jgi:hypothetical protein